MEKTCGPKNRVSSPKKVRPTFEMWKLSNVAAWQLPLKRAWINSPCITRWLYRRYWQLRVKLNSKKKKNATWQQDRKCSPHTKLGAITWKYIMSPPLFVQAFLKGWAPSNRPTKKTHPVFCKMIYIYLLKQPTYLKPNFCESPIPTQWNPLKNLLETRTSTNLETWGCSSSGLPGLHTRKHQHLWTFTGDDCIFFLQRLMIQNHRLDV